jgi:uncharacterized protein
MTHSPYTRIVKPHYQLLGMLLERRDLREQQAALRETSASPRLDSDLSQLALQQRIEQLDNEIRAHIPQVRQAFHLEGRSLDELQRFIGDDLMIELTEANHTPLREFAS